jgi:prolyl-tRNA editing enzyme YbaK/EbsC (Cys-tRNA(Pro) deacylase)
MIPEKVANFLKQHGMTVNEFEPGSTATAEMAAQQNKVLVGQIVKSMLCIGKDGNNYMVMCPGDRKINSSKFRIAAGTKSSFASAEQTYQATGFLPGGVCPFGVENVTLLVDVHLSQYDRIFPAAGTDNSAVPTTFDQLVAVTGARVVDVTESR